MARKGKVWMERTIDDRVSISLREVWVFSGSILESLFFTSRRSDTDYVELRRGGTVTKYWRRKPE